VAWIDFLKDSAALEKELGPDKWLRIESPGEDFDVERAILLLGADGEEGAHFARLSPGEVREIAFENGRIWPLRQWYRGWQRLLERVHQSAALSGCRLLNDPREIAVMFDKAQCHAIFQSRGVPVPKLLGTPASLLELLELMREKRCARVFLKPCHSSSASGVVALESSARGMQAFSSVEVVQKDGRIQLFNSLRVRRYRGMAEIAALLDTVCHQRSIAEVWFPKAGFDGRRFDLRVLVIAGRAAHVVMRQSAGPITNLHLGNERGNLPRLRERMGESSWQSAMRVCEQAAAAFPGSLSVAVDLLVAPGFHRFAVAEVNAFGDLLPNLEHEGMDTYSAQIAALPHRRLREIAPASSPTSQ
jgi:glutathione synthase/RimK-type ligase-like ATP-grasp enzyme